MNDHLKGETKPTNKKIEQNKKVFPSLLIFSGLSVGSLRNSDAYLRELLSTPYACCKPANLP